MHLSVKAALCLCAFTLLSSSLLVPLSTSPSLTCSLKVLLITVSLRSPLHCLLLAPLVFYLLSWHITLWHPTVSFTYIKRTNQWIHQTNRNIIAINSFVRGKKTECFVQFCSETVFFFFCVWRGHLCLCFYAAVVCVCVCSWQAQLGHRVLELGLIKLSRSLFPKQSVPPSTVLNSMSVNIH